ncbi:hypothetical protein DPMN_165844 [Dreissena polymorpha]|uniref:Uncharacterized protein n=1 Tax=Dreissena polymorpha TaxID=45954 RepID=A0A9D4IX19_DREPO|nr:hypothetical protein DPMN_165844 [Dreissena polymorpha]
MHSLDRYAHNAAGRPVLLSSHAQLRQVCPQGSWETSVTKQPCTAEKGMSTRQLGDQCY